MKNTIRVLSIAFAFVLCFGLLAACGNTDADPAGNNTNAPAVGGTTAPAGTEAFVAPPDVIGKIIAADSTLITWNTYKTDDDTIDFMGVDLKALGDASAEMELFYLENDVTYYLIKNGKLVDATIQDVVRDCVVGITTLEEGVQEVYIISTPVEEEAEEMDDPLEEIIEETEAETTAATEDPTPSEEASIATEPEEEGTPEDTGSTDNTEVVID